MLSKILHLRTFKQWSLLGRRIRRGSQHVARDKNGVPVFAEFQTYIPYTPSTFYVNDDNDDSDWGNPYDVILFDD